MRGRAGVTIRLSNASRKAVSSKAIMMLTRTGRGTRLVAGVRSGTDEDGNVAVSIHFFLIQTHEQTHPRRKDSLSRYGQGTLTTCRPLILFYQVLPFLFRRCLTLLCPQRTL